MYSLLKPIILFVPLTFLKFAFYFGFNIVTLFAVCYIASVMSYSLQPQGL